MKGYFGLPLLTLCIWSDSSAAIFKILHLILMELVFQDSPDPKMVHLVFSLPVYYSISVACPPPPFGVLKVNFDGFVSNGKAANGICHQKSQWNLAAWTGKEIDYFLCFICRNGSSLD